MSFFDKINTFSKLHGKLIFLKCHFLCVIFVLMLLTILTESVVFAQTTDPIIRFLGPGDISRRNDEVEHSSGMNYPIQVRRKNHQDGKPFYNFSVSVSNPLERELLNDAADGKWDDWNPLTAALIAEGMQNRNELMKYQKRVDRLLFPLKQSGLSLSQEEVARRIFDLLHQSILVGNYDRNSTDLAHAIDTGHFNCVSATVLYHAMAESMGLEICGLEVRGHALSRVHLPDHSSLDLETTCPDWFKIRNNPKLQQEAVSYVTARPVAGEPRTLTGISSAASERNASKVLREITGVQLIATIYYNQGVDLINAKKFDESIAVNVKALHLDPYNENAWGHLLASINNKALGVSTQNQQYEEAVELLDKGLQLDPQYELFQNNLHCLYYQWVTFEAEQNRFKTAFTLCEEAIRRFPQRKNLLFLRFKLHNTCARQALERNDFSEAFAEYDLAVNTAPLEFRTPEIELTDVLKHAERLYKAKDYASGAAVLDRTVSRHFPSSEVVTVPVRLSPTMDPLPEVYVSNSKPGFLQHTVNDPENAGEEIISPKLRAEISALRDKIALDWAKEALRTGNYPEAIRRVCSGKTPTEPLPEEQLQLLITIHRQWIDALRAEGRHHEADYLDNQAEANPFLKNHR